MRLSSQLAIAMASLVLATLLALGLLTYHKLQGLTVPHALERLQAHAQLSAGLLEARLNSARENAESLRASRTVRALVQSVAAGDAAATDARLRLQERFSADLHSHADLAVLRVIDAGGAELVRVDNIGPSGAVRVIDDDRLGNRAGRDYFRRIIGAPPGELYVSPVGLTGELGNDAGPAFPTIRIGFPVAGENGRAVAAVVLNINLKAAIAWVKSTMAADRSAYLVNAAGDFIVHPDHAREFAFERGWPDRLQDEFPEAAEALFDSAKPPAVIADRDGRFHGFTRHWIKLAGGPSVALVETTPFHELTATREAIESSTLAAGGVAVLVALATAFLLARSLTRPLVRITEAVEGFARGEDWAAPGPGGSAEIAVLSDRFDRMVAEAQRKEAALRAEIAERNRVLEFLTNTINSMVDPVVIVDTTRKTILTNPPARPKDAELATVEDYIGNPGFERLYPDRAVPIPHDELPMVRALRGEVVSNSELLVRRRSDGLTAHFSANGRPIRSESGEVQGAVMVYRDITRMIQARQRLVESEEMARAIVNTALDAFVQVDAAGAVVQWSPTAAEMFGWTAEQALGRDFTELAFPAEDHARVMETYRRLVGAMEQGGPGQRVEIRALRQGGAAFPVELSITALKRKDGVVVNAFIRDLTERVAAEQQLRQAQKMELIGQLTGGVAHDFNNMLTVITGAIDILAAAVADRPEAATIARLIGEAADRGADLTRQLLAYARLQPLQPARTDVNALVRDLRALLRPTLGASIAIVTALDENVWPVFVDRAQLDAALLNLAMNARDAMPQGGTLRFETRNVELDDGAMRKIGDGPAGQYVMITVRDTGHGVPDSIREKVFDPFFTTKAVGRGTGLGLSMVYGFIKQSGGQIALESEAGRGAAFHIYLPRAAAEAVEVATLAEDAQPVGGSETILVVEDDDMVRQSVVGQLHRLGYATIAARNGEEALRMSERGLAFDLLFTDVVMPGALSGVDLARTLSAERPALKVLFTCGYAENALTTGGRLDDGVLLLAKPYRRRDLARMVRLALSADGPPAAMRREAAG